LFELIIADVEGVIAPAGGSEYAWNLDHFVRLREQIARLGVPCVLCTGRPVPYAEALFQALEMLHPLPSGVRRRLRAASGGRPFRGWPSIVENGACFYDPLTKLAVPHPALTPPIREAFSEVRRRILEPLACRTGAQIEAGKDYSVAIAPPFQGDDGVRVSPAAFRSVVEEALGDSAQLLEVANSQSAVDLTPKGVSKASALRVLLDWTGLDPAAVLGVGDTLADEAWLAAVGFSAAPSNGDPALTGIHYRASQPETLGLCEILEHVAALDGM
jgi:hydroxymethylpyrimidine pyrophosphatase-like HAD family hydrolase